ncbi:protein-L-isoaspartate O-methyltransferase family protein [Aestuariivita boseongensis]|uniref:protein-L-isoaspartate O-methyltransferase family protein n=1 Tax=Aestuariivita boseongensis TaxID=1470562 RepID=UPI000682B209|nr:protein-L-isoaspartate O-methyltransferase [Aestuariivita boseongensis]
MPDYALRRRMMVDTQVRPSDVTKFPIIDAMLSVPRELFVPNGAREAAYAGEHVPLADQRVVLDPRILAKMLDALEFSGDELVLDIGGGLGYSSALMSRMAQAVVLLEEDADLAEEAQTQLSEIGADNVIVQRGALAEGDSEHGPYDVIILQGGVEDLPDAIAGQLKEEGRIACLFMEGALGSVKIGRKIDGDISWRFAFNGGAPVLPGFEKQEEFSF